MIFYKWGYTKCQLASFDYFPDYFLRKSFCMACSQAASSKQQKKWGRQYARWIQNLIQGWLGDRAVARTLTGGGCISIYSGYARLTSCEINFIAKETSRAEPEYMNIHPPPPIATALLEESVSTSSKFSDTFINAPLFMMKRVLAYKSCHYHRNNPYATFTPTIEIYESQGID